MAGYTRQSSFADGDTITAALFNNEYNQLVKLFLPPNFAWSGPKYKAHISDHFYLPNISYENVRLLR